MTDLILFDVDGTLIDSSAIIIGSMERTAAELGLEFPGREAGFGVVGLTLDIALRELFGDAAPVETMVATYTRVFQGLRGTAGFEEAAFDGIQGVLDELRGWGGAKLGVATGKRMRGVDHIMALHGWRPLFDTFQTPDSAPSKPHPGMILNGMQEVGSAPGRTVMIGDSVHDMRMAKAAGVTAIGVSWGFQPPALLAEAGADMVARQVGDLPGLVAEALRRPR